MRRSPETLIAHLRNRKLRVYSGTTLLLLVFAMGQWLALASLISSAVSNELPLGVMGKSEVLGLAFQSAMMLFTALALGASIGALIVEVTGCTRNDLLVQLWDRVQALEHSQRATAKDSRP